MESAKDPEFENYLCQIIGWLSENNLTSLGSSCLIYKIGREIGIIQYFLSLAEQ